MTGQLVLEDKTTLSGTSFGAPQSIAGEVVFTTGMVGYPESFTDPSYCGQILVLTYPIIGNYGVPDKALWESKHLQISGLIVSDYINTPSHFQSQKTLGMWLKEEGIPGLVIKDTRFLTKRLREKGTMLGKIEFSQAIPWYDPNRENLVARVSTIKKIEIGSGKKHVILIDCGAKENIARSLVKRGVKVTYVPWDHDPLEVNEDFDGLVISNGPGNPKLAVRTIQTIAKALKKNVPTFGICLGHQLLALAAGGDTQKLKYGHRSQNQPCLLEGSKRCFITTQNHGFAVNKIPSGFKPWFTNANDGTNEGIIHEKKPFMSVQFHPEAAPGPTDMDWLFDFFLEKL